MLVFWDQRLVILATPKTGSTSVAAALESMAAVSLQRPPVLKHTTVHRYHRFVGPYLAAASGHRFTVVARMREPRDWLASWYRFRRREDQLDPAKSTTGHSFEAFVQAYCSDPQPDHAAVGAQGRFLRSRQGEGVDHLFRYEDAAGFVGFLEDRLNRPIALPRLNVSPSAPLDLAPNTERRLRAVLAEDFELYAQLGAS